MRRTWLALTMVIAGAGAHAQNTQPLGTVAIADADVTTNPQGAVPVSGASVKLAGSSTIIAKEGHNAELSLARGGNVLVCQTSVLHATPANDALLPALVLALDRGAMEIHMKAAASDVVMTPDMRMTMSGPGELDLRMRVTFNGDTCVENHGRKAPALNITDAFGEASYQVKAGQHVMFEHGSLREVVDRETTPCGCPPIEKQGISIADALLSGKKPAAPQPFPAAQSEGLAAPAPEPPETPGTTHVQLSTTLTFDPDAPPPTTPPTVAAAAATPSPAAPAAAKGGPFRAIGRFFKRIFAH